MEILSAEHNSNWTQKNHRRRILDKIRGQIALPVTMNPHSVRSTAIRREKLLSNLKKLVVDRRRLVPAVLPTHTCTYLLSRRPFESTLVETATTEYRPRVTTSESSLSASGRGMLVTSALLMQSFRCITLLPSANKMQPASRNGKFASAMARRTSLPKAFHENTPAAGPASRF